MVTGATPSSLPQIDLSSIPMETTSAGVTIGTTTVPMDSSGCVDEEALVNALTSAVNAQIRTASDAAITTAVNKLWSSGKLTLRAPNKDIFIRALIRVRNVLQLKLVTKVPYKCPRCGATQRNAGQPGPAYCPYCKAKVA